MAMMATWKVTLETSPVANIEYRRVPVGSNLVVKFKEGTSQEAALKLIRFLDPDCKQFTNKIKLSRKITPQYLGSYLLEQEMIDQACYEELQREMDKDNEEHGRGRHAR